MNPSQWGVGEWLGVLAAIASVFGTFASGVAWCVNMNSKMSRVLAGVDKINGRVGKHDGSLEKHTRRLDRLEFEAGITEELN